MRTLWVRCPRRPAGRRQLGTGGLLAIALVVAGGCASDGSERLAMCVGKAAQEMHDGQLDQLRRDCPLGIRSGDKIVAFPPTPVSSEELRDAGLTTEEIGVLNELQLLPGPYTRINIVPANPGDRPNRTTYHRRFVEVPQLLFCEARGPQVSVALRRRGAQILWTELTAFPSSP